MFKVLWDFLGIFWEEYKPFVTQEMREKTKALEERVLANGGFADLVDIRIYPRSEYCPTIIFICEWPDTQERFVIRLVVDGEAGLFVKGDKIPVRLFTNIHGESMILLQGDKGE